MKYCLFYWYNGDGMNLYTILLFVSIFVLIFVIYKVTKNKMNIHYSLVWILWAVGMIVISIFPEIVTWITKMLGIQYPSNTIFLIFIFLIYALSFYLYLTISKHNDELVKLNYEIANLKKKINELEKKIK